MSISLVFHGATRSVTGSCMNIIPGSGKKWFINHGEEQQACSLAELLTWELHEEACVAELGKIYVV